MLATAECYVLLLVTRARDTRDSRTDELQALIDRAIDDPDQRGAIATLLFGDEPAPNPPGNWQAPTAVARDQARATCAAAACAARATLLARGSTTLPMELAENTLVKIEWRTPRADEPVMPAPLVSSFADARALRVMWTLMTYAFTRHSRHLWDQNTRLQLMQRLNAFAQLELILWHHAADGGHTDPPPYTVRFDLARWLWHPALAGSIFCLRCGDPLTYSRAERRMPEHLNTRRDGRCRPCAREREHRWPDNAIEPDRRGTWVLRCTLPGCAEPLVGRRQALYCERHRPNRLNRRHRPVPQNAA
jgi:hypothetical protein